MSNTPKFCLIICTYMRANVLLDLLESVKRQTVYPTEIMIVDGSVNEATKQLLEQHPFENLRYFLVGQEHRGLTRQRNFGIAQLSKDMEIVSFLDDDTVLEDDYFENILKTFAERPDAIGVGGVAINENKWKPNTGDIKQGVNHYVFDGFYIAESSRNRLRNKLGLNSDQLPGVMPEFSNGRTFSYPLTGKSYPVDLLIGMAMNFRASLFDHIRFSTYFEGYGLYEDADFSLRARQYGQNYICTAAKLSHFHEASGRPNQYRYGKMVLRNGWYVWRVKYPNPGFKARIKWNAIALLLTLVRLGNTVSTTQKKAAFTESAGRVMGWFSLIFNKPKLQ